MGEITYLCFLISFSKGCNLQRNCVFPRCREEEELWCWGHGPACSPHHFPFLPLCWQRVTSHPVWSAFCYHLEVSVDRGALLKFICNCWAHWCLVPEQFHRQWAVVGLSDSLGLWACGVAGENSLTRGCWFCWLVNSDVGDRAPLEPSSQQPSESHGGFSCRVLRATWKNISLPSTVMAL